MMAIHFQLKYWQFGLSQAYLQKSQLDYLEKLVSSTLFKNKQDIPAKSEDELIRKLQNMCIIGYISPFYGEKLINLQ